MRNRYRRFLRSFMSRETYTREQYEGLYCTPCESFWTESQLVDGKMSGLRKRSAAGKGRSILL